MVKNDRKKQIYTDSDYLAHMCDLMRTQIYFIMRFNLYESEYQRVHKLQVISEHIGLKCLLIQTL